jgi:CRP-like cAMP-binding protein
MAQESLVRPLLTGINIFSGLSEEVMESLASNCRHVPAAAGEIIVRQGDAAHEMFVIAGGRADVIKHAGDPGEIHLATLGKGEFFGEMCIIECMSRAATVRAAENCELFALSNGDLLRLFRRWPDQYAILILNISRDLCRRMRQLHELLSAYPEGPRGDIARLSPIVKTL